MIDEEKRLASILPELLRKANRIIFNQSKTNLYYLLDLYQTYISQIKTKLTISKFFDILNSMDSIIAIKAQNISFSIIGEKRNFNRDLCQKIKLNDEKNNKAGSDDEDLSSEEITNVQIKPIAKTAETKKPLKTVQRNLRKTYDEVREIIINSFQQGIICPSSSFGNASSEIYGSSFDFRQANCKNGSHPHGNFIKFMECCNDIVEIKRFGSVPYVKRKDFDSVSISEKRQRFHYSFMGSDEFDYHIELMIVNMFPTKVTIEYPELLSVFEDVYKKSLKTFFPEEPKNYLGKMKSENLRIIYNNQRVSVTLVPSWNKEYKKFGNVHIFSKVQDEYFKLFSNLASITEKIPDKVYLNKIDANYLKIMKSIFSNDECIELAALNIPKLVQKNDIFNDRMHLFKRCESEHGIVFDWLFFNQNLRLN